MEKKVSSGPEPRLAGVNIYPEVSRSLVSAPDIPASGSRSTENLGNPDVDIDAIVNQGSAHSSPITTEIGPLKEASVDGVLVTIKLGIAPVKGNDLVCFIEQGNLIFARLLVVSGRGCVRGFQPLFNPKRKGKQSCDAEQKQYCKKDFCSISILPHFLLINGNLS